MEYFDQVIWNMWISCVESPRVELCACRLHSWMKTAGVWLCVTEMQRKLLSEHCLAQHMTGEWLQSFSDQRAAAFIPSFWNYRVREAHHEVIDPSNNSKKPHPHLADILCTNYLCYWFHSLLHCESLEMFFLSLFECFCICCVLCY